MALAMPILIINMGGEMIYILEQRLEAQNVPKEKGLRVLADVTRTMYNPSFIEELFKPQDMYSVTSVRQIFDRLAHSSIMRLNEASMDKLFDLMLMGFKYQLIACAEPRDLLQVTQNHLVALAGKVGDSAVSQMVMSVSAKCNQAYRTKSAGEWGRLRAALAAFFQDRKVKVSLFLQDGIQRSDGTIAIVPDGLLPQDVPMPGTITCYDSAGLPKTSSTFAYPLAGQVQARNPGVEHVVILGTNLYRKDRSGSGAVDKDAQSGAPRLPSPMPVPPVATPVVPVVDSSEISKKILSSDRASAARSELNLLASLITTESAPSVPFKINLFPDANQDAPGASGPGKVQTIEIDVSKGSRREALDKLVSSLNVTADKGDGQGGGDEEDDLLSLMDKAGSK